MEPLRGHDTWPRPRTVAFNPHLGNVTRSLQRRKQAQRGTGESASHSGAGRQPATSLRPPSLSLPTEHALGAAEKGSKNSLLKDFPGGTVDKSPPANAGYTGLTPVSGRFQMLRSNKAHEPLPPSLRPGAREPQLLKPERLEPTLWTRRNHSAEKPTQRSQEQPPLAAGRESRAKQRLSPPPKKIGFKIQSQAGLLAAQSR